MFVFQEKEKNVGDREETLQALGAFASHLRVHCG